MPTTETPPLTVTVFHACTPAKHFGDDGCVHGNAVVTEKKPPAGDWSLLYELHVPTSTITQQGKSKVIEWETAKNWPMQASSI
jgi:hypothetical protein